MPALRAAWSICATHGLAKGSASSAINPMRRAAGRRGSRISSTLFPATSAPPSASRAGGIGSTRACGPEIDNELELGRLHHRHVGGFSALENAACIKANLAEYLCLVWPIAHQATCHDEIARRIACGNPVAHRQRHDLISPGNEIDVGGNEEISDLHLRQGCEGPIKLALGSSLHHQQLSAESICRHLRVLRVRLCVRIVRINQHAERNGPGASSLSSSILLATNLLTKKLTPVAFPPGRLRLATSPNSTGSPPVKNTIGRVRSPAWPRVPTRWTLPPLR